MTLMRRSKDGVFERDEEQEHYGCSSMSAYSAVHGYCADAAVRLELAFIAYQTWSGKKVG